MMRIIVIMIRMNILVFIVDFIIRLVLLFEN